VLSRRQRAVIAAASAPSAARSGAGVPGTAGDPALDAVPTARQVTDCGPSLAALGLSIIAFLEADSDTEEMRERDSSNWKAPRRRLLAERLAFGEVAEWLNALVSKFTECRF
jgi:hypothetical protein